MAIAALAYFNVDIRGIMANPGIQKFLTIFTGAWNNFLVPLGHYLWTSIANLFPTR